jgi:hypothetical protein
MSVLIVEPSGGGHSMTAFELGNRGNIRSTPDLDIRRFLIASGTTSAASVGPTS